MQFYMMLFISFKASGGGHSIRFDTYMSGDSARLLTVVSFPLMDRYLCFQILSKL